ncbi:hypothetical protein B0E37_02909 [Streptomyces sp. MH192]|nr:hypothetical protein [Streptomyces sp. MH192]MCF0097613.1 hypothetical protein [Streptomyces sp. MH191]
MRILRTGQSADDKTAGQVFGGLYDRYIDSEVKESSSERIAAYVAVLLGRWCGLAEHEEDTPPRSTGPSISEAGGPLICFAVRFSMAEQTQKGAAGDIDWPVSVDSTIVRAHQLTMGGKVNGGNTNDCTRFEHVMDSFCGRRVPWRPRVFSTATEADPRNQNVRTARPASASAASSKSSPAYVSATSSSSHSRPTGCNCAYSTISHCTALTRMSHVLTMPFRESVGTAYTGVLTLHSPMSSPA